MVNYYKKTAVSFDSQCVFILTASERKYFTMPMNTANNAKSCSQMLLLLCLSQYITLDTAERQCKHSHAPD